MNGKEEKPTACRFLSRARGCVMRARGWSKVSPPMPNEGLMRDAGIAQTVPVHEGGGGGLAVHRVCARQTGSRAPSSRIHLA